MQLYLLAEHTKIYFNLICRAFKAIEDFFRRPYVATSWSNLGAAWDSKGDYDKAIGYYEKALASDLKSLGSGHPSVARDWNNLGAAFYNKKEYARALSYFEKARMVWVKAGLGHNVKAVDQWIASTKKAMASR